MDAPLGRGRLSTRIGSKGTTGGHGHPVSSPHRPLTSQGDAGQSPIMAENALAFNEYMLLYSTEYM